MLRPLVSRSPAIEDQEIGPMIRGYKKKNKSNALIEQLKTTLPEVRREILSLSDIRSAPKVLEIVIYLKEIAEDEYHHNRCIIEFQKIENYVSQRLPKAENELEMIETHVPSLQSRHIRGFITTLRTVMKDGVVKYEQPLDALKNMENQSKFASSEKRSFPEFYLLEQKQMNNTCKTIFEEENASFETYHAEKQEKEMHRQISELTEKIKQRDREICNLKNTVQSQKDFERQCGEMQKEINRKQREIEKLTPNFPKDRNQTRIHTDSKRIVQLEDEKQKINEMLELEIEKANRRTEEYIAAIRAKQKEIEIQSSKMSILEADNINFRSRVADLQKQTGNLDNEKRRLTAELQLTDGEAQKREHNLKSRVDKLQQHIENQNKEVASIKAENEELRQRLDLASKDLAIAVKKLQQLHQQLDNTRKSEEALRKELDDTKSRLSRAMGDKLTDNNPSIADLSDKNRPTKISERYQELYDNQWTDAFEVMQSMCSTEEEAIKQLKSLFLETVDFCRELAMDQMKKIKDTFSMGQEIPSKVMKPLKDCRKALAEDYGRGAYGKYLTKLNEKFPDKAEVVRKIDPFLKECFEICWLMAVQDPPVVIGPDILRNSTFDTDRYKAYTKSGECVDFVVWPVLLLHQGGPVLCKGVAQGCAKTSLIGLGTEELQTHLHCD